MQNKLQKQQKIKKKKRFSSNRKKFDSKHTRLKFEENISNFQNFINYKTKIVPSTNLSSTLWNPQDHQKPANN